MDTQRILEVVLGWVATEPRIGFCKWDRYDLPEWAPGLVALRCPDYPDLDAFALWRELEQLVNEHGGPEGAWQFLAGASDEDDLRDRRALLVTAARETRFKILPRLPLPPAADAECRRGRPLRPLEVALVRIAARDDRRYCLVCLLAAGATEREAGRLRVDEVDLPDDHRVLVTVGGARGRRRRTLQLVPGTTAAVANLIATSQDGFLIAAGGTDDERARRIDHSLRQLLDAVGLTSAAGFTAMSIHHTGIANIEQRLGLPTAAAIAGTDDASRVRRCGDGRG